jgi:uncharacterized membrane protein SpoIIM required for sporulation
LKETEFIKQNKDKWARFESAYSSSKKNPEELSKLYLDFTEDLGYSQTFYNRRTVRVYLNQLAQKVFLGVHKQSGQSWKKMLESLIVSLPLEIYRSRKTLFFAFISFLIYALIGVVTTYHNPDFPRIVMGDAYVDMTIDNISRGNPLAVYDSQSQLSMFIHITTNNLKVAFLTFAAGFFFTIGAHILLFSNGVMLGAFQYFFQTKGLLVTSFLGIWIHGAFEISAIILAGGAGITAGNGILFPKSYTRLQSLKLSTMRGLKIMISLIPFIVMAGFLESYVTRNYQVLPEWSKWCIIFFSFAAIVIYYVFIPFIVSRKYPHLVEQEDAVETKPIKELVLYKIRTETEVIRDSFQTYWMFSKRFLSLIFAVVFPIALLLVFFQGKVHTDRMAAQHWFDWYVHAQIIFGFGKYYLTDLIVGLIWSFLIAFIFQSVFWSVRTETKKFQFREFGQYFRSKFWNIYLSIAPIFWLFFFIPMEFKFVLIFIVPLFVVNAAVVGLYDGPEPLKKAYRLGTKNYSYSLLMLMFFSFIAALLIQPIASVFSIHQMFQSEPIMRDLLDLITDYMNRSLIYFTDDYMYYSNSFRQLVYLVFVLITLPLFAILTMFSSLNTLEREEAIGLRNEFKLFGKRKKHQE